LDLAVVATTFALIFPVELPDKTFVASLVLATRYRPPLVWLGVSLAFLVQCAVAVAAGGLLSLLPSAVVAGAAAVLFLGGAVVLWRGAATADEQEAAAEDEFTGRAGAEAHGLRVVATSFGVLFLAEWGDLSQLLTAGLAARSQDPVSVFAGSWLALVVVAGLAVLLGRTLLRVVRLSTIRRVGATVCLVLAAVATYDVISSL
jgi:putative Ca2+/H+ antiporter (TMEM165/GDT1 family)